MTDAPITLDYADINGLRLHLARAGAGRLILCLHGFPEFWYQWRRQLALFGRDRLVVAPDQRGYNLSSKPRDVADYRARAIVEDTRQLARHFGADRFTLVAHDWGGAVAWAFALAYPQLLDRLIIINSPHPAIFARELATNPAQAEASRYMLMFREPDAEARLAADNFAALWKFTFRGLHERGQFSDADRDAYLAAWSQPGALTGALNWYRASPLRPPAEDGSYKGPPPPAIDPADFVIRVPTLVIWGERDRALLPSNLDGLQEVVPDLAVRRIPDAGHWVLHERPDAVNGHIRDFLGG